MVMENSFDNQSMEYTCTSTCFRGTFTFEKNFARIWCVYFIFELFQSFWGIQRLSFFNTDFKWNSKEWKQLSIPAKYKNKDSFEVLW